MSLQMQRTQGTMFNSNITTAGQVRAFAFGHDIILTMYKAQPRRVEHLLEQVVTGLVGVNQAIAKMGEFLQVTAQQQKEFNENQQEAMTQLEFNIRESHVGPIRTGQQTTETCANDDEAGEVPTQGKGRNVVIEVSKCTVQKDYALTWLCQAHCRSAFASLVGQKYSRAVGVALPSPQEVKRLPNAGEIGYVWEPMYNQSKTHPYNERFRQAVTDMVIEEHCQPGSEHVSRDHG
jgi:hypothetical protein